MKLENKHIGMTGWLTNSGDFIISDKVALFSDADTDFPKKIFLRLIAFDNKFAYCDSPGSGQVIRIEKEAIKYYLKKNEQNPN